MPAFKRLISAVALSILVVSSSAISTVGANGSLAEVGKVPEYVAERRDTDESTKTEKATANTKTKEPTKEASSETSGSAGSAKTATAAASIVAMKVIGTAEPADPAKPANDILAAADNKPTNGSYIAGCPAELYMLSIAGETAGAADPFCTVCGDKGRAYGFCQLDYRYDLVKFMNFAYDRHPELWSGFSEHIGKKKGDATLIANEGIKNTFDHAMSADFQTAIDDQFAFLKNRYWDTLYDACLSKGLDLSKRHVAVSAALFSVSVNCGPHAALFAEALSDDMSDQEMIDEIYRIRNTTLADETVLGVRKGTSSRYRKYEPQMAHDLLFGNITIDSEKIYGAGVEWHGNPFAKDVIAVQPEGSEDIAYDSVQKHPGAEEGESDSEGGYYVPAECIESCS